MLAKLFENLRKQNRAALIAHITCGYPSFDFCEKLIETVCASGADIIELGIPFSDPIADGTALQQTGRLALDNGATLEKSIDMVARLRQKGVNTPFVMRSYLNPMIKLGVENTAKKCEQAKINGVYVVDLPIEQADEITTDFAPRNIDFITLVAPTTSVERVAKISQVASGFLYYVADDNYLAEVCKASSLPIVAAFEISEPEIAKNAATKADAIIIAGKIAEITQDNLLNGSEDLAIEKVSDFVKLMAKQMVR